MTNENTTKKQFVAPVLIEYGKFEELTQAAQTGSRLDAAFNSQTPVNQLTFS